jgi:hypothetical protein
LREIERVKHQRKHMDEFELLVASSLWPRRPVDREVVRAIAQKNLDWSVFEQMVLLHRLAPIVFHNLKDYAREYVPAPAMLALERHASNSGLAVFNVLKEILRISDLFGASGIPLRILKGIPLGIVAYGDAGLRNTGDIDLLIDEQYIASADALLQKAGYRRIEPLNVELTPRRFAYYISHWKDFVYEHASSGDSVELHWRLTRNRAMPGARLTRAESISYVALGSRQLPTLAFDDLFLYLCLHGALDGWMRLKALADIVALCREMKPEQIERLAKLAAEFELLPEMSAAILLARRIFHVDVDRTGLLPESHPIVRRILRFSSRAISGEGFMTPRESISGLEWARYEMGLRRSLGYRWQIVQRLLFRPRVWARFPLPDSLFLMYPLLSPIEWLFFHGSRLLSERGNEDVAL